LWAVSGYIYTGQASVDMDMDGKFHIQGNPGHMDLALLNTPYHRQGYKNVCQSYARYKKVF